MARLEGSGSTKGKIKGTFHPGLASGVTAENYSRLGSEFIAGHGGEAFVIALEATRLDNVDYPMTLKQWGAWLAYFRRKRIRHGLMLRRNFWTVPAEWPHLFDMEATVIEDETVGEEFARRHLAEEARRKSFANRPKPAVRPL